MNVAFRCWTMGVSMKGSRTQVLSNRLNKLTVSDILLFSFPRFYLTGIVKFFVTVVFLHKGLSAFPTNS